jgi:pyruvate/2-oxoglutarate dehydrogenase complex dihydrolipoamide acyltransferase (E2) component
MDVVLPKWGVTMQEGTLTGWRVAEGSAVAQGEPIADIVTDKVEAELEAPIDGVLTRHCVDAGDVVAVGAVVATIEVR